MEAVKSERFEQKKVLEMHLKQMLLNAASHICQYDAFVAILKCYLILLCTHFWLQTVSSR